MKTCVQCGKGLEPDEVEVVAFRETCGEDDCVEAAEESGALDARDDSMHDRDKSPEEIAALEGEDDDDDDGEKKPKKRKKSKRGGG